MGADSTLAGLLLPRPPEPRRSDTDRIVDELLALRQAIAAATGKPIKGDTVRIFGAPVRQANGLSDLSVDVRGYNAVSVEIIVQGSPGATVTIEGAAGQSGEYKVLPDHVSTQAAVNANRIVDLIAGQPFVKVRLASGTYSGDAGYVVNVTPFVAANLPPQVTRLTRTIHRSAITAVDKLTAPTAPTLADVTTGGSLVASSTYYVTAAALSAFGPTTTPTATSQATAADASNTHVMRTTLGQTTGATHYDLFCSTDAAPKWVARITEAQRAAGCTVTAVGTVTATTPGAGIIDIRVAGTGVGSTAAPFAVNNAYVVSGITSVSCTGYARAHIYVQLAVTDLRSAPTLSVLPLLYSQVAGQYHQGLVQSVGLLAAVGQSLLQDFAIDVDGASDLIVLVDTISGQNASCSVWVELA